MQEAVILAGGLGTRLKSIVKDLPKAMAPVNGRPFIEYLLSYLHSGKISRTILSVGYSSKAIVEYFGSEYKGMKLDYAIENEPLGTGGGLRLALEKCNDENVLALNGDTLFLIDLFDFSKCHLENGGTISIALRKVNDVSRYGSVKIDSKNKITAFGEKPEEKISGFINGGIYVLNQTFFLNNTKYGHFSIEKDCFEKWITSTRITGFPYDAYFLDIGIPEDYLRAQDEFKRFAD